MFVVISVAILGFQTAEFLAAVKLIDRRMVNHGNYVFRTYQYNKNLVVEYCWQKDSKGIGTS